MFCPIIKQPKHSKHFQFSNDKSCFIHNGIIYDTVQVYTLISCFLKNIPVGMYSNQKTSKTTLLYSLFNKSNTVIDVMNELMNCNLNSEYIYKENIEQYINRGSSKNLQCIHYTDTECSIDDHILKFQNIFTKSILNRKTKYVLCIDNITLYNIKLQHFIHTMLDKYVYNNTSSNIFVIVCYNNKIDVIDSLQFRLFNFHISSIDKRAKMFYIQNCLNEFINMYNIQISTKTTTDITKKLQCMDLNDINKIFYINRCMISYKTSSTIQLTEENVKELFTTDNIQQLLIHFFHSIDGFIQQKTVNLKNILEQLNYIRLIYYDVYDFLTIISDFLINYDFDNSELCFSYIKNIHISKINIAIMNINHKNKTLFELEFVDTILNTIEKLNNIQLNNTK